MNLLLNILWFIFGGFLSFLAWGLAGIICCITIIGIPVGVQCFKFAKLSLAPFGKDIIYGSSTTSIVLNIIWILTFGWSLALSYIAIGIIYSITIIGIPLGVISFRFARLAFLPFGAKIVPKY